MSQINISNLTFYYEGSYESIFESVSFQIDTDWKLALVGRNGRGKTTLLKLLMGEYEYLGQISKAVECEYFPYQVKEQERLGIDVLEELDPSYELWRVCRELNLLKVDPEVLYRPFETLSQGEQTKVMLGILFAKEHKFLLIDEPTNHLDRGGREIVMNYLKGKRGFILVSHDRAFLDGCVDHVLAINKSNIEVIKGNFQSWWNQKERQDASEMQQNEKLLKEVSRLASSAKEKSSWSNQVEKSKFNTRDSGLRPDRGFIGHKSAKMMKRAIHTEKRMEAALEDKKKLLKNVETAEDLKLFPLRHHKERLVSLAEGTIAYEGQTVCEQICFQIDQGGCFALEGDNGCGKSSILKVLMGDRAAYQGTLEMVAGLKISYVPQDTSFLKGSLDQWIDENQVDERLFKALLRKLDFDREHFAKPMETYSAGQKKKVLLAKSLCEQAHLYIWDEPLNYIDIFSRMQIEQLIKQYRPTILLVEHDRRFLEEIGAELIAIRRKTK